MLTKELWKRVIKKIEFEEGYKTKVYPCTAGYKSVGFGRNLDIDRKFPDSVINLLGNGKVREAYETLLLFDINKKIKRLNKRIGWWVKLPDDAKLVIIDLAYNLGVGGLLSFKKTLRYIKKRQWISASKELLNSDYARKDVPNRAKRNSNILRSLDGTI